jgi:hypothetical protein
LEHPEVVTVPFCNFVSAPIATVETILAEIRKSGARSAAVPVIYRALVQAFTQISKESIQIRMRGFGLLVDGNLTLELPTLLRVPFNPESRATSAPAD